MVRNVAFHIGDADLTRLSTTPGEACMAAVLESSMDECSVYEEILKPLGDDVKASFEDFAGNIRPCRQSITVSNVDKPPTIVTEPRDRVDVPGTYERRILRSRESYGPFDEFPVRQQCHR